MSLTFMRHGEALNNVSASHFVHKNDALFGLTEKGAMQCLEQARAIPSILGLQPQHSLLLCVSPQVRAQQTAAIVQEELSKLGVIHSALTLPVLKEVDIGFPEVFDFEAFMQDYHYGHGQPNFQTRAQKRSQLQVSPEFENILQRSLMHAVLVVSHQATILLALELLQGAHPGVHTLPNAGLTTVNRASVINFLEQQGSNAALHHHPER